MRGVVCMIKQSSARKLAVNMVKSYAVLMKKIFDSADCSDNLRKADENIENYRELFICMLNRLCGKSDTGNRLFSDETIEYVLLRYKNIIKGHSWYSDIKKYPSVAYETALLLFDLIIDSMKRDGVIE